MKEVLKYTKETFKSRKKLLNLILAFLILLILISMSYAFFTSVVNNSKSQGIDLNTGILRLRFADDDEGINEVLDFGKSVTKKFLIENIGTLDATVDIYWDNLINTYLEQSLTYKLEYKTSIDSNDYINVPIVNFNIPTSENPTSELLAEGLEIPAGITYYYNLTITLEYLDHLDQIQDLDAIFSTYFALEEGGKPRIYTIQAVNDNYLNKIWKYKYNINKIVFERSIKVPITYTHKYDISHDSDGSVMAYLIIDEDDPEGYIVNIQAKGKIYANPDTSFLFKNFINLKVIEGLEFFDTSRATNMYGMFNNCNNLSTLDLSNFNTKNVTNMHTMFYNCYSLTELDLSHFDTRNVIDMSNMFQECFGLESLNVRNFDTRNVTEMKYMFYNCNSLLTLDLGNFNTSNVIDMHGLFHECNSLISINLSSFDTKNTIDMHGMFYNCYSLRVIDLSNFDTSNVTNMCNMFQNCNSLESVNVSSFNTSKVTDMHSMFYNCSSLTDLSLSNFDTSKVTDMHGMFRNCESLTSLNVSNFDTREVTNMNGMFRKCINLTTLDLSDFDTRNVIDVHDMFYGCKNLAKLNLSDWDVSSVTIYSSMLFNVPIFIKITVSNESMQIWLIDVSDSPKLTTSNFVVNV